MDSSKRTTHTPGSPSASCTCRSDAAGGADTYLGINEACAKFGLSRRAFYRMLEEFPQLERDGIVMRIPPVTGRRKVGARAFEEWNRRRNGLRVHKKAR